MRWPSLAMLAVSLLLFSARGVVPATTNVNIGSFYFDPAQVTILINDSVQWNWIPTPENQHTTTHLGGLWSSPQQMAGSFTFQFTATGYYPYICTPHQWMFGSVTVRYPQPAITSPQRVAGEFQFTYSAFSNALYVIESSTNLTQWRAEATNRAAAEIATYTNAASHDIQFYRVRRFSDP